MTGKRSHRLVAEFIGSAFFVTAVVGSSIMGERLAGGNVAVALLANTIATGAALVVLILTFGPNESRCEVTFLCHAQIEKQCC